MLRTHNCGALNESHTGTEVVLSGWVHKMRDKGFIVWVDLRDRYGVTQLVFDEERSPETVFKQAQTLGREYVIQVKGAVIERESKNPEFLREISKSLSKNCSYSMQRRHRRLRSKTFRMEGTNCVCNTVTSIFDGHRFATI